MSVVLKSRSNIKQTYIYEPDGKTEEPSLIDSLDTFSVNDPTKIQDYLKCERMYFYKHVRGFRPTEPQHALLFGKAYHEAKAILLREGYSENVVKKAYQAFLDDYRETYSEATDLDFGGKNPANVELALLEYVKRYRSDRFRTLHTEVGITVPISRNRVLYGKMDSIVEDERGIFSLETKTTKMQTNWWADHWMTKFQINTYTHFLYCYYEPENVYGVIVDGTVFRKSENDHVRVSCRKSIDHLESWLWEANRILDNLEMDFDAMYRTKESDRVMKAFPRRTESCVQYNKLCQFFDICHSWNNPLQYMHQIPVDYKIEHWDPRAEEVRETMEIV